MIKLRHHTTTIILATIICTMGCRHEPKPQPAQASIDPASTQYPLEIANIIVKKCVDGCHNAASYAGRLRLDDWQYLFDGGANGAMVVPYNSKYSPLLYFINTDSSKGLVAQPRMPYDAELPYDIEGVTAGEYDIIKKWIENGAPDKNGNVAFSSNAATRQKIYLTMQNCDDLVAVVDAEKKVVMRYIYTGANPSAFESPHYVQTDKQGRYAYVCLSTGHVIQKIDLLTDSIVGTLNVTTEVSQNDPQRNGLSINIMKLSEDGSKLIASQLLPTGYIFMVNTNDMSLAGQLTVLENPHGIACNQTFDTFYITGQFGNVVYKVAGGKKELIPITADSPNTKSYEGSPDPHEIIMHPDYSRYFLTCQKTNEVRVMDRLHDTLLKIMPVGKMPLEMAISKNAPYLFVTCQDDPVSSTIYLGTVYVINYNTYEVVKKIEGKFAKPHGVAVDDRNGVFYVASTNHNTVGGDPHHPSTCGGKNGYYQVYDLYSLEPFDGKTYEISTYPYSIDTRFKD